jgi:predicted porin
MNKKTLTLAVAAALATPTIAHAVKYKLSGQINRAMTVLDDGHDSDVQFIDNSSSGTRWRMQGSEDVGNGWKVGFNWEWQVQSNKAGGPIKSSDTGLAQDLRKAEVWFSSNWGKVSFGQGDGAGNGTTEHDLSDTWNVAYSGRTSFGGSVAWRTAAGAGITSAGGTTASTSTSALTHGATFSAYDAFSRYDRVRYDTPALGPVTLSVSAGQRDKYEAAARWSQGLGGGQISAGLFYGRQSDGGVDNRYGGSIAYLFSFGTNILISAALNDPISAGAPDAKTWYAKVGHKWGNNAVSIGYGESEDVVAGFNDKGFNIGFNHNIPKAKVDLYAGYHFNQLDTSAGTPGVDDIQAFVLGTKLKFD